jgi:hypothetical protein
MKFYHENREKSSPVPFMGAHDGFGPDMVCELMDRAVLPCVEDFEGMGGVNKGGGLVEYSPACWAEGRETALW